MKILLAIVKKEYSKIEEFKIKSLNEHKNMLKETTNIAWSILDTKYNQFILEKDKKNNK